MNNLSPKISLIVPIYNTLQFLDRCLTSIKNQTLKDIEVILVIDGSPDDSESFCKEFIKGDDRFVLKIKKNGGLSSARNYGLKFAKGDYISFVDSDDYLSLDYCKKLTDITSGKSLDIVDFGLMYVKDTKESFRFSVLPKNKLLNYEEIQTYLIKSSKNKMLWYACTNLFRREFLIENTIFFDESILLGEDSIFNLKCFYNAKSTYSIEKPLYYYVYNSNSLTQKKYKKDLLNKLEVQFDKRLEFHKKNKGIDSEVFFKDISNNYVEHSLFMLLNNIDNSLEENKIEGINKIRASRIFDFSFDYYKYSSTLTAKMKLIIFLFKKRKYYLLSCVLRIKN